MRQLIALVREAPGWTVSLTGGGHYRIKPPAGRLLFVPSTPSDWRSIRNARADLRKLGLEI
jgi:hypothetical protein